MNPKIYAGIVVYGPNKNLYKLVKKLLEQGTQPIIFVNKSNQISDDVIKKYSLTFFLEKQNVGVSKALNTIINFFINSNADYLFTFDQDSDIPNDFVLSMVNLFQKALNIDEKIVCCSPKILDLKFQKRNDIKITSSTNKQNFSYINFAITSGSLYTKKSFKSVGYMNELLFIDGVDTDWCERSLLKNFKLIMAENIYLFHKIGSKFIKVFGITKSYHDQDLRVYYIIRNSVYLLLSGSNRFKWKLKEFMRTLIRIIAYPILSSTKIYTLYYLFLAIRDGLIKKMGKMEYTKH